VFGMAWAYGPKCKWIHLAYDKIHNELKAYGRSFDVPCPYATAYVEQMCELQVRSLYCVIS
jgi:hypothetical protein